MLIFKAVHIVFELEKLKAILTNILGRNPLPTENQMDKDEKAKVYKRLGNNFTNQTFS